MSPLEKTTAVQNSNNDDEISLLDLLQVIVENLRILILAPLGVGILALGISFFIPPSFTANTAFLPQQQASAAASMLLSLGAIGGIACAAAEIKDLADQYVAFLQSRAVQDALIKRFDLQERYQQDFQESTRKTLAGMSKISAGKDGLITIAVEEEDPQIAADIANAYVDELSQLLSRLAVTEAQRRRVFFEKQLQQTKAKLVAAQQTLAASGVSVAELNISPDVALEGPARLRAEVTAQEVKLASMRSYLTENAPAFKQAMSTLTALKKQLSLAEKVQNPSERSQDNDYINNYREYKYQETLFELFTKQFELAKIDEGRESPVIQVVDVAQVPELKSKPKKALIAVMATLLTGFMLLFFVFARSTWRNGQSDPATAEKIALIRQAWNRALGRA